MPRRNTPERLLPCDCGKIPEFVSDGMIDFLKCPGCGLQGGPFFDGAAEWLIREWNHARERKE